MDLPKALSSQRIHGRKTIDFNLMANRYIIPKDVPSLKTSNSSKTNFNDFECFIQGISALQRKKSVGIESKKENIQKQQQPLIPKQYFKPLRIDPKIRETFTQFKKITISTEELTKIKSFQQTSNLTFKRKQQQNKLEPIEKSKNSEKIFIKSEIKYLNDEDDSNHDYATANELMKTVFNLTTPLQEQKTRQTFSQDEIPLIKMQIIREEGEDELIS